MVSSGVDLQCIPRLGHLATYSARVGAVKMNLAVSLHHGGVREALATNQASPVQVRASFNHGL